MFFLFLSANVFASNAQTAQGDAINQPGYMDVSCQNITDDYVAALTSWTPLVADGESRFDAAIAETSSDLVDSQGVIVGVGR